MTTRTARRSGLPEAAVLSGQLDVMDEAAAERIAGAEAPMRLMKDGKEVGVVMSRATLAALQDELERLELLVRAYMASETRSSASSEEALAMVRRKLAKER